VVKTRMVWLRDGEKNGRYDFSFWHNTRRDRQTDERTDTARQQRLRLCTASRGKILLNLFWILNIVS